MLIAGRTPRWGGNGGDPAQSWGQRIRHPGDGGTGGHWTCVDDDNSSYDSRSSARCPRARPPWSTRGRGLLRLPEPVRAGIAVMVEAATRTGRRFAARDTRRTRKARRELRLVSAIRVLGRDSCAFGSRLSSGGCSSGLLIHHMIHPSHDSGAERKLSKLRARLVGARAPEVRTVSLWSRCAWRTYLMRKVPTIHCQL